MQTTQIYPKKVLTPERKRNIATEAKRLLDVIEKERAEWATEKAALEAKIADKDRTIATLKGEIKERDAQIAGLTA